jgi:regulatory protein
MNTAFLQKIAGFCAYQERTHAEVRERLREWGIWGDEAEEMILYLIEKNYLNEERFAKAFAGGKFRVKNWGKMRIKQELKQKGMSEYCVKIGLSEIDDQTYFETIKKLINRKSGEFDFDNPFLKKQKIARYIIGKGYESELVWRFLGEED